MTVGTRRRTIGFDRKIQLNWLDATADWAAQGLPVADIRTSLEQLLDGKVAGEAVTKRHILAWTAVLVPASLLPALVAPEVGAIYLGAAGALGGLYLWRTLRFVGGPATRRRAMGLFGVSVLYLFALFTALVADVALGGPSGA